MVCEPAVVYNASIPNTEDFLLSIPDSVMHNMVYAAIKDYESGHCITTEQLDVLVKKRMGW